MTEWGLQGDCIFYRKEDSDWPKQKLLRKLATNVLFEGEVVGHKHRITEGDFELFQKDDVLYLKANSELKVEHEEHRTTTIVPGKYIVDRPREMDHVKNMERRVID